MYIALSTQRISLPKSDACAAFSVEYCKIAITRSYII